MVKFICGVIMKNVLRLSIVVCLFAFANMATAACSFDVEVGDYLKFSSTEMTAEKSCESVTVNLIHSGKLPAKIMGHNWVLSKTADVQALATAGMSAGLAASYVPPGDDRVLAYSAVIGGGEKTTLTFSTEGLTSGEAYTFFCSFPGHSYSMRGVFNVAS
tara:strand:+ start:162 stop:641 length:480 start_codon:yes stop_codon:yes gene_type:complete